MCVWFSPLVIVGFSCGVDDTRGGGVELKKTDEDTSVEVCDTTPGTGTVDEATERTLGSTMSLITMDTAGVHLLNFLVI